MENKKKSGTRSTAECVTDVLTTFWRLLWSVSEQTLDKVEPFGLDDTTAKQNIVDGDVI